jgi:hypothetical protein
MKVTIDADLQLDQDDRTKVESVPMMLEAVGSQVWIRIAVGGRTYEVDYGEFWDAARAVCIDSYQ